jgi:FKBP-type peptidyl-prolyl cis-trans isomerase SlpA
MRNNSGLQEMNVVTDNSQVTLHFALMLEDGGVVDSTFDGKPAALTMGDGNLLPGFEAVLHGLAAGDEKEFVIVPENAFGMPNPSNVQYFKRSDFASLSASDVDLQEGLIVSFADATKAELPGVVKSVSDTEVMVDFNHPLAGKNLRFKVKIIDVR